MDADVVTDGPPPKDNIKTAPFPRKRKSAKELHEEAIVFVKQLTLKDTTVAIQKASRLFFLNAWASLADGHRPSPSPSPSPSS
jgi:hypothetical protein